MSRKCRVLAVTGFLALPGRHASGPYELWYLTVENAIDTTRRNFLDGRSGARDFRVNEVYRKMITRILA